MKKTDVILATVLMAAAIILTSVLATATVGAAGTQQSPAPAGNITRGKYLVDIMGCHDCHTPWKVGPKGPEMDMARALSGHPEDLKMPAAPALPPGRGWDPSRPCHPLRCASEFPPVPGGFNAGARRRWRSGDPRSRRH